MEQESNKYKIFDKSKNFLKELENTEQLIFSNNVYPIIIIILVSIGFISLLIYNYTSKKENILVVNASKEPIKIKPTDPGGMVVPNIDKSVYNHLFSRADELPKVERILPLPEKPLNLKTASSNPSNQALENITDIKQQEDSDKQNIIGDNDTTNNLLPETPKILDQDIINIKKLPKSYKSKIDNSDIGNLNKNSQYRIQLASFKTEKEAINEWRKIKNNYPILFEKLDYYIYKKDITDKGVYYRLQVGPFHNDSEVRILCKKLLKLNQACIIVKK